MLRAVRFAAKLDLRLAKSTEDPIPELANNVANVPPARLFDETLKLFLTGCAAKVFELLNRYDLFRYLFPGSARELSDEDGEASRSLLEQAFANTDERVASGRPVTPMFLFAAILWEPVRRLTADFVEDGVSEIQALHYAVDEVVSIQQDSVAIPRRFTVPMREILTMQPRFRKRQGRRALRLLDHPRFRAAYDFMLLRAGVGQEDQEVADWWSRIQKLQPDERNKEVRGPRRQGQGRRRGRRRRPKQPQTGG